MWYASFLMGLHLQIHRIGLSEPFFARGWGDLGVVDFEEAARLIQQGWPPEHFQAEVRHTCTLDALVSRLCAYRVLASCLLCVDIYHALQPFFCI